MTSNVYEGFLDKDGDEEAWEYIRREEARSKVASSVGRHMRWRDLDHAAIFLSDASLSRLSAANIDAVMVYDTVYKPGWKTIVKPLIEEWIQNDENIRFAASKTGRQPKSSGFDMVHAYCAFRLKPHRGGLYKKPGPPLGLAIDHHQPQCVVFIALEELTPENGFCVFLRRGDFLCLDAHAEVAFPPTGGGLGIFFSLEL